MNTSREHEIELFRPSVVNLGKTVTFRRQSGGNFMRLRINRYFATLQAVFSPLTRYLFNRFNTNAFKLNWI